MIRKINEIRKALDQELYNCALALSLTLPSICANVEYHNTSSAKLGDGHKYKAWFNAYALQAFTRTGTSLPDGENFERTLITADVCWKLRCAVLHAGNLEGTPEEFGKIYFHAHKPGSYYKESFVFTGATAHLDVNTFCKTMCAVVEDYYNAVEDKTLFNLSEVRMLDW